jgi:hypothetical protein
MVKPAADRVAASLDVSWLRKALEYKDFGKAQLDQVRVTPACRLAGACVAVVGWSTLAVE